MRITILICLLITTLLGAIFALSGGANRKDANKGTLTSVLGVTPRKPIEEWLVPLCVFSLSLTGLLLLYFFGGK